MRDLLSIGTSRGCEMIGTGIGLGLSGYRLPSAFFNPLDISGLQVWLDASDSTTLCQSNGGSLASADGDPVGYWLDKSGNNRHHQQTDGTKKPGIKLSTQNGKNGVNFDGVNDYLDSSSNFSAGSSGYSYFIVTKLLSGGPSYPYLVHNKSATNEFPFISPYSVNWRIGVLNFSYSVNTTYLTGFVNSIPNLTAFLNGTSKTGTWNQSGSQNSLLRIGASDDFDSGAFWKGYVFEILGYNQVLSDSQINSVKVYLNSKWSIY